jgi:hypothetical protein
VVPYQDIRGAERKTIVAAATAEPAAAA